MALRYVGAGAVSASTGDRTPALPAGYGMGDLLLCIATSIDNQAHSITGATGWTQIAQFASGATLQYSVWYKLVGAIPETAPTVHRTTTTAQMIARCWAYSGGRKDAPLTVASANNATSNTSAATMGSATAAVTTPEDTSIVLHLVGSTSSTNSAIAYSAPSGVNGTTYSPGTSAGGTSTTRTGLALYSVLQSAQGSSGTSNVTIGQACQDGAIHLVIRPTEAFDPTSNLLGELVGIEQTLERYTIFSPVLVSAPSFDPSQVPWLFIGPESYARPQWTPTRSSINRERVPSLEIIVPASPIPPSLPDSPRFPWNPDRTASVLSPVGSFTVIVPGSPIPPTSPESYLRPNWNPERTDRRIAPTWTLDTVIVPGSPVPPVLPERPRYPWDPERSSWLNAGGPAGIVVVTPGAPVPPVALERARQPWSPERSGVWAPGLPQAAPIWPLWSLPERFIRPYWRPEYSQTFKPHITIYGLTAILEALSTVDINDVFDVSMTLTNGLFPLQEVSFANVIAWALPGTARVSEIRYPSITGAGYATVPTEGPINLEPGTSITFTWKAVAYTPGLYYMYAAAIDINGVYYEPAPASVHVIGVS